MYFSGNKYQRNIPACGLHEGNTCPSCFEKGWLVVSGIGGSPYAINNKTAEKIFLNY